MSNQIDGPKDQYLNIDDDQIDLYRIFSKKRFEQMMETKSLVLVRPEKWADPFENFFFKCDAIDDTGRLVSLREIYREWYGQCWTMHRDTDAMWRIYSPDREGVRVKTTIRKLFRSVFDSSSIWSPLMYFIGKVQYLSLEELKTFRSENTFDALVCGGKNHLFANTLLMKRLEFAHENEVRLLFSDVRCMCSDSTGACAFPIDPNDLFDEIAIDPRVNSAEVEKKAEGIRRLGYSGQVIQSDLYHFDLGPIKLL